LKAPADRAVAPSLPFDDPRHLAASRFLIDEAYLLDRQRYEEWLELLTDDVRYRMPVRVSTGRASHFDTSPGMDHFAEDRYSLERRVRRFATEHAWTEDPPSRLRHHVTNIRTSPTEADDELFVESAVLLFRSRGDVQPPAFLSAGREDLLRSTAGHWRLARREVFVDESVLRMQNLAVFL
jgi:3-phenylpropionate/cinnamic acid dioxygenase small subunit